MVSGATPLFTHNPCNAQQYVTYERAMSAVLAVRHIHPDLVVREVRFQKQGDFWQPING